MLVQTACATLGFETFSYDNFLEFCLLLCSFFLRFIGRCGATSFARLLAYIQISASRLSFESEFSCTPLIFRHFFGHGKFHQMNTRGINSQLAYETLLGDSFRLTGILCVAQAHVVFLRQLVGRLFYHRIQCLVNQIVFQFVGHGKYRRITSDPELVEPDDGESSTLLVEEVIHIEAPELTLHESVQTLNFW
jgi:hypothetical protein